MDELVHVWPIIQTVLTGITFLFVGLIGIIFRGFAQALRELREDHSRVTKAIAEIRELIAGQYVRREELGLNRAELSARMDRMDSRMLTIESVVGRIKA